jgi:mannose-1-phosphate guanylyltransferase
MYSVIMAGGSGTRFWPASRRLRPKQLLALTGSRSLLQQTVDRMAPLTPPEQVLVVTGADQAPAVADQLPEVPPAQILGEPQARNTAPAAGLAAAWAALHDPEAVCVVLPADHLISGEALFHRTLQRAMEVARSGDYLVTLGVTPRYAATGFGYIELGPEEEPEEPKVHQVRAFHEKPDLETARAYLEGGRHLWNAGMFVWRAKVLLEQILALQPELARGLAEIIPHLGGPEQDQALERIYPQLPKISIDHGVLEKSSQLRVVRADFGWSDVGSWEAMAELWEADQHGNASQDGEVLAIEAGGNLVSAGGRLAALLGVDNLVAVVTDDALMILPRGRTQEVGRFLDELKSRGRGELL